MIKTQKTIIKIAFAMYCILMLWLLFGQRIGWNTAESYFEQLKHSINLIPFHTIQIFVNSLLKGNNTSEIRHAVINLAGNIVMFIPLGFFVPSFSKKFNKLLKTLACAMLCIITVEILQLLLLLGSCDIDDLILNMVGVTVGYTLYQFYLARGKRK